MQDSNACANCLRAIDASDQRYCPACGQPTPVHRIDWHFLGHELEHSVLHMDRGIFYTLRRLALRPGALIHDYLDGRRADLVKPLMLLMILSAAIVFLTTVLGTGVVMHTRGETAEQAELLRQLDEWMTDHFVLVTLLLLPLEALAFKLVFRGKRGLNYPEWLVITAYLTAQTLVIWILALLVQRWTVQVTQWVLLASVVYATFTLVQFFRGEAAWKTALRVIVGYAAFMLASQALMLAALVLWILVRRH